MLRAIALTICLAGSVALAAGCGSDDSKDASAEQIREAKAEQKRIDAQNEKNRELQRQLDELKSAQKKSKGSGGSKSKGSSGSSNSSGSSGSSSSGGASATPAGCSGGITVNSATTCGFAQNVRADYESTGGSGPITTHTYSDATGKRYEMQCSGGSPHVCTGGNGAYLTFP